MAPAISNTTKFRPGVGVPSDYKPTLFILTCKNIPSNNVVVGSELARVPRWTSSLTPDSGRTSA